VDYVFLDTETTGLEENDEVIQLSYIVSRDGKKVVMDSMYRPTCKISFKAMAVHGITEEMVADKERLTSDSLLIRGLKKLDDSGAVMFIHNAKFDLGMLRRHGYETKMEVVDTLRCARHLFPEAEGHALGVIYYQYGLYNSMESIANEAGVDVKCLGAHNAVYDVLMLMLVSRFLIRYAGSVEKLIELTKTPVMVKEFSFGKYKGRKIADIAKEDDGYLEWMLNGMDGLDEDLRHTILTHLGRTE